MTTTVTLDEELLVQAREFTGLQDAGELVREALRALVQREAARQLIAAGGSEPGLKAPPRRRSKPA